MKQKFVDINITLFSSAVLVSSTRAVEVLTSLGQYLCSLPDLPDPRHSHSQTGLVTCGGGETPASCLTFSPASGAWAASHSLAKPGREAHSSWAAGGEVSLHIMMINKYYYQIIIRFTFWVGRTAA